MEYNRLQYFMKFATLCKSHASHFTFKHAPFYLIYLCNVGLVLETVVYLLGTAPIEPFMDDILVLPISRDEERQ